MKRRTKVSLVGLAAVLAVLVVGRFLLTPFVVVGDSMEPTLQSWDLCLMVRPRPYQPHREDIVMFRTADDPPLRFVKRVIAVPGDRVSIERGVVEVNGQPLVEPYTTRNVDWSMPATNVPAHQVFVLPDNRDLPQELYVQGFVATRLVQARLEAHWRWR
ncbi:signal peptidase I [bacterium]|nr:signal peptidase I [bacterium]